MQNPKVTDNGAQLPNSLKEDNRPSFQFYPDDWLRDSGLRLCSLAAQGLWIYMLTMMWYGKPRGTLTANGLPVNSKQLAKLTGQEPHYVEQLLDELKSHNVYSVLKNGTIICRRMYREWGKKEQVIEKKSMAGKKGAEKRWQKDSKRMAKMAPSTSSSSSMSSSSSVEGGKVKSKGQTPTQTMHAIFAEEWRKSHKSNPIFTSKDHAQAKILWQQCQVSRPDNPMAEFRQRCVTIMKQKQLDNFAALVPFWNFGAKVNANAHVQMSEISKRQTKEQQKKWREYDNQVIKDLAEKKRVK